jgi:hypothetical protein
MLISINVNGNFQALPKRNPGAGNYDQAFHRA